MTKKVHLRTRFLKQYINMNYLTMGRITACFLIATMAYSCSMFHAAQHNNKPVAPSPVIKAKGDTTKPAVIKPYNEVITAKSKTQRGLFTVHEVNDKYYFELTDSIMGREILLVTRLSKSTPGAGNYGGEEINEQTIRWEKGPSNKIFLRVITLINDADSTNQIYKAVTNSNIYTIAAAFDIKAKGKDGNSVVIDVTDWIKGDNTLLAYTAAAKKAFNITTIIQDRSYIASIKSYPINTEIRSIKTYMAVPPTDRPGLPAVREAGALTTELNNSFILLPKTPMKKRLYDYRVGYFSSEYNVYSDDQQEVEVETYIHRWRLEPKPEEREKWLKGELVEPAKPIIYYIDPATPKQWRPFLIAGINDWQKAFEHAGFKNAIIGKEWPENDTTMSLEDARYSVIRYFATTAKNAYGPNIADPRSGEIIESHIGWYHNVMKLVHDWYFIQAGAIDPRARKMVFEDALMGQLIRFVSSHEIGHTLGLRHNMGASSRTPVEKLRDKKWLEVYGHTASIMDYARFNYVAQPEDSVSETGIFPRINDYDNWAIRWGYAPVPKVSTPKEESLVLNKWIKDSLSVNPRLWFSGEGKDYDPRSQTEDLGDNNMKANAYGMKNLQRIVPHLIEWTKEKDGDDYTNLVDMYKSVINQYDLYLGHVLKDICGVYQTAKTVDQAGSLYAPTPRNIQKEAVAFLNKYALQTQYWLLDTAILNRINNPALGEPISSKQVSMLMVMTSGGRLTRLAELANRFTGRDDIYQPEELLSDVEAGLWSELQHGIPIDFYRRKLQRAYVSNLMGILDPNSISDGMQALVASMSKEAVANSDIKALAKVHLEKIEKMAKAAIPVSKDAESKQHLQFVVYTIDKFFKNDKNEKKS